MKDMKWYALQEDRTDPWDNGTYDIQEALEELYNSTYINLIAVIENGICIEEIEKDDVIMSYYINDSLMVDYFVDNDIILGATADVYVITAINAAARTLALQSKEDPSVKELLTFRDLAKDLRELDGGFHRITANCYYYYC